MTSRNPLTRPGVRDASIAGLVALAVGGYGSWNPSVWLDEAATLSAATRSLPELFRLLSDVDAVHGLYYLFMHQWLAVAGTSELALRAPSVLAAALAAAGLVLLMRSAGLPRAALLAGLALAVIPRFVWAAGEGRSYAFTMLLAVASTAVLLEASGRRSPGPWIAYGVLMVLSVLLFLHTALLIPAHAIVLVLLRRRLTGFLVTSGLVVVVLSPFLALALSQADQVSWIPAVSPGIAVQVLRDQFFLGATALGVVMGVLALLGAVVAALGRELRPVLAVALPVILLPTALLVAVSLIQPMYLPRYLTFAVPALAALIGVALAAFRWAAFPAFALLAAIAAPAVVAVHAPTAKGDDWGAVAAIVAEHRTDGAEGVAWGQHAHYESVSMRALALGYPAVFAGLTDVTEESSPVASGTLWGRDAPLDFALLPGLDAVWVIGWDDPWVAVLEDAGWSITDTWRVDHVLVDRWAPGS